MEGQHPDRAPSLQMWRDYLPNARLIGFDIGDFTGVSIPNCTIFRGNMGERQDLLTMAKAVGSFDIVTEDASHIEICCVSSLALAK
jgi:hypothetical protein